ncbi:hypothetical protein ONZ45_g14989 [Pleurotus djamor]|nr:hypothetical protein ONZ45_g14989 [Pleurotus djamor]
MSSQIPTVQRAWLEVARGHPSVALRLKTDWPVPTDIKKDHVLVKIQAAGLNPVDYKLLKLAPNFAVGRPLPAGRDFAGVVVNGNGTEFKEGDEVFGFITVQNAIKTKQGSLAEYAVVSYNSLVHRPSNISVIEAAGVSLTAQTAYQALFEDARLEEGQSVFINGGSTSVGLFAIQLAKSRGIKVTASASGKNEELVRRMGADEFIDYTKEPLHAQLKANTPNPKFHAIIDAAALLDPSLYNNSPAYLAPQGVFVHLGPVPSWNEIGKFFKLALAMQRPVWLGGVNRRFVIAGVREERAHLQALSDLIAQGELKGVVDSVFAIEDAVKGYERLMTSRATGKVIVTVDTALNLKFQRELTIKEFAANVLSLDLPDPSEIRKTADNSLEHRRKAYCQKKPNASMILCRNDPTLWWGINGDRKPDGHGVTPNTLKAEGRGSVDNLSDEGPKKSPFHPCEVLTFWEFKMFEKDLMAVFNKSLGVEVEAEQAESTNHTTQKQETPNSESSTSVAGKKRAAAPHADDRAAKSPRPSSSPEITPAPRRVADPDVTETPETQCASYALEMLSYGLRQHVISFLISDSEIQFLYYDRSILLRSEPLNLICRWYMFEYIMEHIATFTLEQWGIRTDVMPGVAPETLRQNGLVKPQRYSKGTYHGLFKKVKVPLPNYGTLELGRIIHQTHGLRGRGTLVVNARVLDKDNAEVVVKFSWPAKSRQSEAEILRHVYSKVEAAWKDEEWDPKDHLPNLLHDAEFPDPTGIQGRLFAHFSEQNSEDNPYEERILRVHVFERLYPIDEFIEKPAAFIGRRYFEFVRCLVCVHDIADVLHCDVSRRNFMIRKKGDKLYGVLNDFDLAIMTAQANKGPSSKQRTGTRPFMAIELLEKSPPPPHIHRHDLESCFYLLLDLSSGRLATSWATKGVEDLVNAKVAIGYSAMSNYTVGDYTIMIDSLTRMRRYFEPYYQWRADPTFPTAKETETFGGKITGPTFITLLEAHLPAEPVAV